MSAAAAAPAPFRNGLHCLRSPYVLGDIPPHSLNPSNTWIASIQKVRDQKAVVGYVYVLKDGTRLIQPTYEMTPEDLHVLALEPLVLKHLRMPLPAGLSISDCSASEMTKRMHG